MSPFDLTICLRVIYGGVIELDAEVSTPILYLIGYEVRAVVSNNVVQDTIMVYDIAYKIYHRSGFSCFYWFGLFHLVNLSTMTSKYFFLWLPPLRSPTMSSPQTAKGQVMGIVLRDVGSIWL